MSLINDTQRLVGARMIEEWEITLEIEEEE